jgi:predicted transposase YbfD/YdcC
VAVVEREEKGGGTRIERRFVISSLEADAAEIARAVRAHWGIENSVHWVLDVTFGEDASRARTGNAPENLSALRRWALNLLPTGDSSPLTIAARRKKAAWNTDHLFKLLTANSNA